MTLPGLDAWITGNYGQDQFPAFCPRCRDQGYNVRLIETADGSECPECGWSDYSGEEEDADEPE